MEISAISWLGIWPSFTWDREQPCPDRALVLEMVNKFAQRAQ
jgi:hypothetical protein